MTDPAAVMAEVRASIEEDGVWLVADIKAHDTYEENVERNPMAALMYGTSVLTCLSSSLSEPGGLDDPRRRERDAQLRRPRD